MDITKKNFNSFFLATQSLHHIYSLSVSTRTEYWKKIVTCLGSPALALTKLEMVGPQIEISEDVPWPQNLFGGNAPRLHQLSIRGLSFPGYQPVFHGLTSLSLDESFTRTRLAMLLGALDQMPELKSLTLMDRPEEATIVDDEDLSSLTLPVVFPNLEELSVYLADLEWSIKLVSSLRFAKSPTLSFELETRGLETAPDAFQRILPVLHGMYPSGMASFSAMRAGMFLDEFEMRAGDDPTHENARCTIRLSDLDGRGALDRWSTDWYPACHDLPITNLVSLQLYGSCSTPFFHHVDKFQHLRNIFVDGDDWGVCLTDFLSGNFRLHCDEANGSMDLGSEDYPALGGVHMDTCLGGTSWDDIIFPKLETITFCRCAYYETLNHKLWMNALKARRRHGYGPKKIILEECDEMDSEDEDIQNIQDLQGVVEFESRKESDY